MIELDTLLSLAALLPFVMYAVARLAQETERRSLAWKLTRAAESQEALAAAERSEHDTEHERIHQQTAWAFHKAAEMIRAGRW